MCKWKTKIKEVSNNVFKVTMTNNYGSKIEKTGTNLEVLRKEMLRFSSDIDKDIKRKIINENNTKNRLEPKKKFESKVREYYVDRCDNQIPTVILNTVISKVTDQIYSDYKRFWKQYPKSRKRYSTLKLEDLDHPFIYYLITDLLKSKEVTQMKHFSKILFRMSDEEYEKYLDQKDFYETK